MAAIILAGVLPRAAMAHGAAAAPVSCHQEMAGVPIAAGLLYPFFGILISPMFAAFAMSASSISVVLNALRLRTVRV